MGSFGGISIVLLFAFFSDPHFKSLSLKYTAGFCFCTISLF